jgi:hypothetical protein
MLSCNCKIIWTLTNDEMIKYLLGGLFIKDLCSSLGKCNDPTSIFPSVQFPIMNERRDQWLGENKDYYVVLICPYDTSW